MTKADLQTQQSSFLQDRTEKVAISMPLHQKK